MTEIRSRHVRDPVGRRQVDGGERKAVGDRSYSEEDEGCSRLSSRRLKHVGCYFRFD